MRTASNGETAISNDLEAHGREAVGREGLGILGSCASGLRRAGLSVGIEGLCGPSPFRWEVAARDGGAARRVDGGSGPSPRRGAHRAHQGGRGSGAPIRRRTCGGWSNGRGVGGAVSRRPRGRPMQAGFHRGLPVAHQAAHIAGVGRIDGGVDRARPCGDSALPPSRQALHGQRGGELAVAHADPGRGVGAAPGGRQPVQVRAPVCVAQARTVPVGCGVSEVGENDRGAARRGQGVAGGGGGDPAPDADGVPTQRDTDAALGRCGP